MLQNIREGIQGPWAIGIVAVIVVSFVFTGVGSYISSSNSTAVAIVNGEEIDASTLDTAYQNERGRLESQFGDAVNALFASESYINQFRADILERLIDDKLVSQKAEQLGLRVSDAQIKETLAQMPEFQIAGSFDNTVYNSTLARAGFTPAQFAEYMRGQMSRQQLDQSIRGTGLGLSHQVERILALQEQTRDAKVISIDIEKYQDSIELTEEEIQSYYDMNLSDFDTEEQVKLAYISLSVSDLTRQYSADEAEIEQAYQDNLAFYTKEEERRISHILFETLDGEESAQERAQEVLSKLSAGEDFATLAENYSDDIVSAEIGGDLSVISRGDYSGAFEDAAFGLEEVGDTTDVVSTEFGLHIIKLTELKPATVTPLAEVREELKEEIITKKATDEYFSLQNEMARLAFEEPDSLSAVAEAVNRPIIETPFFEAGQLPAGVNYPQLNDIAFSSELIDEGVNSELIELSDDLVMIVRVAEHKPERTRALSEVRAQIETELKSDKAQAQAYTYAQNIQTAIANNEDVSALLAEHDFTWEEHKGVTRDSTDLAPAVVDALFSLGLGDELDALNNSIELVTTNSSDVALVQLTGVTDALSIDEAMVSASKNRIANAQTQQTYENFVEALRETAEIEIITQ